MKNMLLYNWTLLRILWVAIGIIIIADAIYRRDMFSIIGGLIYTTMGVFNKMCMFSGNCSVPVKESKDDQKR